MGASARALVHVRARVHVHVRVRVHARVRRVCVCACVCACVRACVLACCVAVRVRGVAPVAEMRLRSDSESGGNSSLLGTLCHHVGPTRCATGACERACAQGPRQHLQTAPRDRT